MDFEVLKEGNRILDEMKSLRDSIFSINEYLPKTSQKNKEQKSFILQSKRTDLDNNYIKINENRRIFSKLVLYDVREEDLLALKEALEKRLEEYKKAFEAL